MQTANTARAGSSGTAPGEPLPDHLIHLPGGRWACWRTLVLRGAGFPVERLLELSTTELGALSDRFLDLEAEIERCREESLRAVDEALDELRRCGAWENKERRRPLMKALRALSAGKVPKATGDPAAQAAIDALCRARDVEDAVRSELRQAWESAHLKTSRQLADVVRWDRFREAVTWQNRHALETALREIVRRGDSDGPGNSQQRQHDMLVANYLQRYCAKNDTIGFFGPVGWASLEDGGATVTVQPGERLLAHREVYFENWCLDMLAKKLARQRSLRPWLIPRLKTSMYLEGDKLYRPFGAPVRLSPSLASLLAALGEERPAQELAEKLVADPEAPLATRDEVFRHLDALARKRLITWGLEFPLERHPETTLRRLFGHIGPPDLREEAMAALDELDQARYKVAGAAGDPAALDANLKALEETFTRLTGHSARQNPGQTYAARGLVYEDCRRDVEVCFGPGFLERLGPPLTLVLQAARWLAGELRQALEGEFEAFYETLRHPSGSEVVDSAAFYGRGLSSFFAGEAPDELARPAEREYQSRWAEVLGVDPEAGESHLRLTVDELESRVARAFGEARPMWKVARHICPDVMIAAADEDAVRKGHFDLVLGEVHAGHTFLTSCFVSQHPEPQRLFEMVARDVITHPVVGPQVTKDNWVQRINPKVPVPSFFRYDYADAPEGSEEDCQCLPAASVVVEPTDRGLRARTRDGRLSFAAIEFFGPNLNDLLSHLIPRILPPARHLPRVSIDGLVVFRERWKFSAAELEFVKLRDPLERYLGARRWARHHRIRRFCFYKAGSERKPFYLDLESSLYTDLFSKMVRSTIVNDGDEASIIITEMLPRADQTWLRDAQGHRYTSELRLATLDLDEPGRFAAGG